MSLTAKLSELGRNVIKADSLPYHMCFYGHKEKKGQDCYKNDYVGNAALPGNCNSHC